MKTQLNKLLFDIQAIKKKHEELRSEDRFNIFYALHKENDEVNLHSRFISYLLAQNSGHRKGNLFAKLFFENVLNIKELGFLYDYKVIPNEFNKTEFKEIDILLFNKNKKHAIIIENKIYAKDSNHIGKKEGYNGQLERYYNTISEGFPEKSKNNKPHLIPEKIDVFYLTVKDINPKTFEESKGNIPENVGVKIIYYKEEIVKWLNQCLIATKDDYFLNKVINQYLILVKNMTNTNIPKEELDELRNLFSDNLETTQYIINNFKNIKWHTVDNFLETLKAYLNNSKDFEYVNIYPANNEERAKLITKMTHHKSYENLGVTFYSKHCKKQLYISTLNNLSWGIVDKKWTDFKEEKLQNIRFSDFATKQTFNLISKENTKKVINKIIEEILTEQENNFENLSNI